MLALISLSLAIINLFPFLPLDGGHIFWSLVEKIRGRPVPFRIMEQAGVLGFMLVIFLFVDRPLERHRPPDRGGLRHALRLPRVCSAAQARPRRRGMERATVDTKAAKPGLEATDGRGRPSRAPSRLHPDRVALRTRGGEQEITWGEYGEQVDRFALGLRELGLERGDVSP